MADSTLNQIVSTDTITDDDLLLCYRQAINATRSISAQNFNKVNADRFEALELLIPSDTSESNQLVNKSEVLQKLQFTVNATNVRHIIFPSGYTGAVVVRLYMCNATNTADVRILGYNQLNNNYKGVYTQTGGGLFVNIATNYQIDICNASSTSVDVIAEIYASQTASVDAGTSGSFSYWGANFVNSDCSLKQNKTLDTPLTIGGVSQTTVEGALSGINGVIPSDASASNKVLVHSDLTSSVTSGSTAPITSGGVYNAVTRYAEVFNSTTAVSKIVCTVFYMRPMCFIVSTSESNVAPGILQVQCGVNNVSGKITTGINTYIKVKANLESVQSGVYRVTLYIKQGAFSTTLGLTALISGIDSYLWHIENINSATEAEYTNATYTVIA